MNNHQFSQIKKLAPHYIWWKPVDEVMLNPQNLIAQIMNIGDYEDVQLVANLLGDEILRDTLLKARAGQFSARSWHYWHYRLGLLIAGERIPELPKRVLQ